MKAFKRENGINRKYRWKDKVIIRKEEEEKKGEKRKIGSEETERR